MSVAPPAAPVLGSCGVSVAPFCRLGLLRALPCRVFAGRFLWFSGPSSWSFLGLFTGVLPSRFWWLLVAWGSSWTFLGYPPSVAWQRVVFCRGIVGLPCWGCGASGFLGPAGLMVFAMGHLPRVGPVVFLSPQSLRSLSLLPVGLVLVLRAGFPSSGWRCVFRHALVQEAVPPSHRLVLLLRTGFLFSGPGLCGRRLPFPSHMYSFGMWSPFGSTVSFCHSWSRTKVYIGGCFFSDITTQFWGSSRRIHTSSFSLSEILVAGGHAFTWLVTVLCQWAVFSWPPLLLSYEP